MLQFIRERAQSWIAWVIIGLIIIPFALWGVQEYARAVKDKPAATVNKSEISQEQAQRAYYEQRQRIAQLFGGKINPDLISEEQIRKQALEGLIEQELLLQVVGDAKMRVSDDQLVERIREIEIFQENGKFSQKRYEQILIGRSMSPQAFEASLRQDAVLRQLQQGVTESAFATKAELDAYHRLKGQQRDIGYLVVPAARFTDAGNIPEAELRAYYDSHQGEFVRSEQVKVAYIELARQQIAAGIEISEADLRQRYDTQIDNYRSPEQRRASHILIAVQDPAKADEAQKKAEQIRADLEKGAAFAEMAKKHSEDPGSASQGGDLGFFGRGNMVKEFEEAVFSMKPAEITQPIRTQFGFHIIRLDEVRPAATKSFEELKPKLLEDARLEAAEEKFYEQAESLTNLAYEHPESLEPAANALGLKVKESPYFGRQGGRDLFAQSKVINTAFSDEVLNGNNSEPIELEAGRTLVLRLADRQPEATLSFEDAKPTILARLSNERTAAKAKEAAEGVAARLREGANPSSVAAEFKGEWKRREAQRQDPELPAEVVKAAFALTRPSDGKPTVERVALGNGDQAVVALFSVKDGEPKADADKASAGQLVNDNGQAAFKTLVDGIRARSSVEVSSQQPGTRE